MKLLFINLNKLKMYVLFYVLLLSKEAQSKKKKMQSQETSLIFYSHDWKFFLKYNIGCPHHSKRIILSMKEYVFDDWECSTTQDVILNCRRGQQGWLSRHSKFLNTNK